MFKEMILIHLEEAQGYQRLINDFSYDQEKVSKFIGKSRSYIYKLFKDINFTKMY